MRRTLLVILMIGFVSISSALSQGKCFEKGDILLNAGFGIGNHEDLSEFFIPNFRFSAGFGVHDYVDVGPYLFIGFDKDGARKTKYYDIGAQGTFHWWQLLDDKVDKDLKQDQLELYFTGWIGGEVKGVKLGSVTTTSGGFEGGATLGIRYYPKGNNTFAISYEFGRSPLNYGEFGATLKIH